MSSHSEKAISAGRGDRQAAAGGGVDGLTGSRALTGYDRSISVEGDLIMPSARTDRAEGTVIASPSGCSTTGVLAAG